MAPVLEIFGRFVDRLTSRLYLWVALAVIVPRLGYVAMNPQRNVYGNAPGLLAVAANLADGRGYIGEEGKPDSYFNPGYPAFLAACRLVAGDHLLPIKLAQVALDTGTALGLCWLLQWECSAMTALSVMATFRALAYSVRFRATLIGPE